MSSTNWFWWRFAEWLGSSVSSDRIFCLVSVRWWRTLVFFLLNNNMTLFFHSSYSLNQVWWNLFQIVPIVWVEFSALIVFFSALLRVKWIHIVIQRLSEYCTATAVTSILIEVWNFQLFSTESDVLSNNQLYFQLFCQPIIFQAFFSATVMIYKSKVFIIIWPKTEQTIRNGPKCLCLYLENYNLRQYSQIFRKNLSYSRIWFQMNSS